VTPDLPQESCLLSEKAAKESIMVQVEAAAVGAEAVTKLAQEEKIRKLEIWSLCTNKFI